MDYMAQQYIVELKVWRGPRYNADGEKQIMDYLDFSNRVGFPTYPQVFHGGFKLRQKRHCGVDFAEVLLYSVSKARFGRF